MKVIFRAHPEFIFFKMNIDTASENQYYKQLQAASKGYSETILDKYHTGSGCTEPILIDSKLPTW